MVPACARRFSRISGLCGRGALARLSEYWVVSPPEAGGRAWFHDPSDANARSNEGRPSPESHFLERPKAGLDNTPHPNPPLRAISVHAGEDSGNLTTLAAASSGQCPPFSRNVFKFFAALQGNLYQVVGVI